MRKKIAIFLCCIWSCCLFAGCGSKTAEIQKSSSVAVSSDKSETKGEGSALSAPTAEVPQGNGSQMTKMQVFVQQESNAEVGYEPTIRLMENGKFEFSAFLYDGTVLIEGNYKDEDDRYILTTEKSSAPQEAVGGKVHEITLKKTEDGVVYSGDELGVTADGSLFVTREE